MIIDHSAANTFRFCPDKYRERYLAKLELDWEKLGASPAYAFGSRVHNLVENRLRSLKGDPPVPDEPLSIESLESEAQEMFQGYCAHYPVEPFSVVDVERVFKVPLGENHVYTGKFDGVVRDNNSGVLQLLEHKTESRSSLRNLPIAWAARDQVSLYLYAIEQVYGETGDCVLLDVLRRASPKGQIGPEFYRDTLQRTPDQLACAVSDLIQVADHITEYLAKYGPDQRWPQNRDNCVQGRFRCDYYDLHIIGREPSILSKYKPAEEYLNEGNPDLRSGSNAASDAEVPR